MPESNELKRIKRKYGEDFMRLCRELFPTILEKDGQLEEILSLSFAGNSRTLCQDIVDARLEEDFKDYIYGKISAQILERKLTIEKNPYELFNEVGYDLIECLTEDEIQEFRKYYEPNEELCTFNGGRLNRCVVFFAVKKNVENIKREDFEIPQREDEYGTSVMGIQFNREGMCTVSIKNRYNHTVNNPDATYGNDLDRIVPGLTQSFAILLEKEYGLKLNSANVEEFEIPGYVVADDGRYYKYNVEMNGLYYCPGNIVIQDGTPKKLEKKESQILIDYFVLDMRNKIIKLYDTKLTDSFLDAFQNLSESSIEIEKSKINGTRVIKISKIQGTPIIIEIDRNNQIIGYENNELKQVGDYFLHGAHACKYLKLPNLELVGNNFLFNSKVLKQLKLPRIKKVGNNFLYNNQGLTQLEILNLEHVGDAFLLSNNSLRKLRLPNLIKAGDDFLCCNQCLEQVDILNLEQAGDYFLYRNNELRCLKLPKLQSIGNKFLLSNKNLCQLELPNLPEVRKKFLHIVDRNNRKVDSKIIAQVDKDSRLTNSDIVTASDVIKDIKALSQKRSEDEK